jgi:endonuclease/exonuclease/phosphatase family metal-dependent hydrolase
MQTQFRAGTLNVHSFEDDGYESNVERLVTVLQPLNIDVLGLQEVAQNQRKITKGGLYLLSQALNMPYISFGKGFCNTFGNAFLSRYPITNEQNFQITLGYEAEVRSMLRIVVDHPFIKENNATLYVTHLDHKSEQIRLKQISAMHDELLTEHGFHIVLGDFNSLSMNDYSAKYLQKIAQVRAENNWEAPHFEVTEFMKEHHFEDCFQLMNHAKKDEKLISCRFKTRVDYIWMKGKLNDWKLTSCEIISSKNATDHELVLSIFTK